jgi:Terminase large subunit, T4likevirus-type, N-terminal
VNALERELKRALDPAALAPAIGMVPDPWQADVLRSGHPRILLNCCRQAGKSQTAAILAVHAAVYEPGSLVLLVSRSQRQSSELFKVAMGLYRALGRPAPSESESALSLQLENGSRIVSLPGEESTFRGFSAVRLLVIDEASRVKDEAVDALWPMLAVSGGRIIALSTPAGMRGWWWEAWENGGAAWMRVRIPASEVSRIPKKFLAAERVRLRHDPEGFAQEYECAFVRTDPSAVFPADALAKAFEHHGESISWPGRESG